jgi:hypothetical protein
MGSLNTTSSQIWTNLQEKHATTNSLLSSLYKENKSKREEARP